MTSRRSHQKSHTGCITCKRRHVKCDEAGPPCKRCETRGEVCEYASVTPRSQPSSTQDRMIEKTPTAEVTTPLDADTASLPFPDSNRHLELQLMHRWSTTTYKSCCTPGSGDEILWQFSVPSMALQFDFLLSGILALSAYETASILPKTDQHKRLSYISSATEYQCLALSAFRVQLASEEEHCENHKAVLCFSLMLMVLAFAGIQFGHRQEEESVVMTAISHFELIRGAVQIAESDTDHPISENEYAQKLIPFHDLPLTSLEPTIAECLSQISEINDKRIIETAQDGTERRVQQIAFWESCKKSLALLKECFQKCVGPVYRGYALGWLNMAGEEYIQALRVKDNVALLILMMWGVLVERLGHDIWWARGFGKSLVNGLSNDDLRAATDPLIRKIVLQIEEFI